MAEQDAQQEPDADVYLGYSGLLDAASVTKICAVMNVQVNDGLHRIYFCLNSLGGYIGDGVALYNHLRGLPVELTMHNVGNVSSMAVGVFLAASRRYTSAHGMFLIHPTKVQAAQGNWEQLQALLASALADEQRLDNILRDRCALPEDVFAGRRNRDTYITPQHAVEYGIAHGIREFRLPRGKKVFQI